MTRIQPTATVDLEQARLNPGSVFDGPEAVVDHPGLSRQQKIEILRRWEYDAAEVSVAVEEGMPARGNADMLHRVLQALESLGAEIGAGRVGPSKHHGIPG